MRLATEPSLIAPEDAIVISEDGGVKKVVVREGSGEAPPMHSRCIVHYVGRLAASGDVFMDTKEESNSAEPATLVAGRDSSTIERGIHLAVATMTVGERAHIWASSDYGYGPRGNFSFPTIPPNADLVYDIELLDFEPPKEGKTTSEMTYEERLEAAERRRIEGNEAFKAGRYEEALGRYSVALSFVDEDLMIQLQGFHYDKAVAARTPALLNSAACHLKLGDYHAAIAAASQVLAEEPGNAKALFRRGAARHSLGQTELALEDLLAAKRKEPGDVGIARELVALKKTIMEEREAQKGVYKGLIDKARAEGGLYSDDDEEEEEEMEEDGGMVREGGGGGGGFLSSESWFGAILRALCPFIFGREQKPHSQ